MTFSLFDVSGKGELMSESQDISFYILYIYKNKISHFAPFDKTRFFGLV